MLQNVLWVINQADISGAAKSPAFVPRPLRRMYNLCNRDVCVLTKHNTPASLFGTQPYGNPPTHSSREAHTVPVLYHIELNLLHIFISGGVFVRVSLLLSFSFFCSQEVNEVMTSLRKSLGAVNTAAQAAVANLETIEGTVAQVYHMHACVYRRRLLG